jgi:hypothetical protein
MKTTYVKIALETEGHYLVGLEPERFLEEFLPTLERIDARYFQRQTPLEGAFDESAEGGS